MHADQILLSQKEHVAGGGQKCPCCGSYSASRSPVTIKAGTVQQARHCGACDTRWIDTYSLTGYLPVSH